MRMTVSHQNNALEHESLVAALEHCKKTHSENNLQQLQEELVSTKDFIQQSKKQKADLEARILALETDLNSRVWDYIQCQVFCHVSIVKGIGCWFVRRYF